MVWRFCLFVFLPVLVNIVSGETPRTVWFQPGTEYTYKYEGTTHLEGVAHIIVSAQVSTYSLSVSSTCVAIVAYVNLSRCKLNRFISSF